MSGTGPTLPTWAMRQVGGYLGNNGRIAHVVGKAGFAQPRSDADKIRIGSPVQWPESQLMANVEPPVAISRSATAVGAVTIETLAFERAETLLGQAAN